MTDAEQLDHTSLILSASREEMADEIIRIRREVRELKEKMAEIAAEEAERKSREYGRDQNVKARWKKLGAPVGEVFSSQ